MSKKINFLFIMLPPCHFPYRHSSSSRHGEKLINIAGHVPEELEDPDLADQMFRQEQA